MSKLAEFRAKYPGAYDHVDDQTLADALYKKYYSHADRREFDARIGLKPYENMLDATGKMISNIPAAAARSKYYVGQAIAEGVSEFVDPKLQVGLNPPLEVTPGAPVEKLLDQPAAVTLNEPGIGRLLPEDMRQTIGRKAAEVSLGQQLRRMKSAKDIQQVDVAPGSLEEAVSTGVAGAVEMAGPLAASLLVRNPAPLVAYFTTRGAGEGYGAAKEAGAGTDAAMLSAALYAAAEAGTEALAGKVFVEGGKTLIGSIIKGVGVEGITEAGTEALQALVDAQVIGVDMTPEEAMQRITLAAKAGAVAGGVIAPLAHGARKLGQQQPTPQIVVTPPAEEPPVEEQLALPAPGALLALPSPEMFAPPPNIRRHPPAPASAQPAAVQPPTEEEIDYQARVALQRTKQAETAELLQTARETITPIGTFEPDEILVSFGRKGKLHPGYRDEVTGRITSPGADADMRAAQRDAETLLQRVRTHRLQTGKPVDAPISVEDMARAKVPQRIIDTLIATRRPLTTGEALKPIDIRRAAAAKNIVDNDSNFAELAYRTTGQRNIERMSQAQLNALRSVIDAMPSHPEPVTVPIADGAPFNDDQYGKALDAVRNQGRYTAQAIKDATGIKDDKVVRAIRDAMVRRGQLVQRGANDYRLYDIVGQERQAVPDDLPPGAFKEHVVRKIPVNKVRIKQNGKSLGTFGSATEARTKIREIRAAEAQKEGKASTLSIEPAEDVAYGVMENRYDERGNLIGQVVVDTHRDEAGARKAADELNAPDVGARYVQTNLTPEPGAAPAAQQTRAQPKRTVPPAALAGRLDTIMERLNALAAERRLPLLGVAVKLRDTVRAPDGTAIEGVYFQKLIQIAAGHFDADMSTDEIVDKLAQVMDHELIHALRRAGVLGPETDAWKTIVRYANRAKRPGTRETYVEWAMRSYTGLPGYNTREDIEEEAIAEAFRHWAANRRNVVGKPATVFRQLAEWFRQLFNALPNDVFSSIESGRLVDQMLKPPGSDTPRAKATQTMQRARAEAVSAQQAQDENSLRVKSREFLRARAQAREDRFGRSGPKTVLGTTPTRTYTTGPIADRTKVADIVDRFREKNGVKAGRLMTYLPEDVDYLQRVADAQQRSIHEPDKYAVKQAYRALIDETMAMWNALPKLEVASWTEDGAPYASPAEMLDDILQGRLRLRLSADMFGEGADNKNHPLNKAAGIKTVDGKDLTYNDVLRVVHDIYGHGQSGFSDTPRGQYNAYHEHARLLSPDARRALATETLAQSAWHNYGPHLRRKDGTVPNEQDIDYLPPNQKEFAEQKAFLLDPELLDADPGLELANEASGAVEDPRFMVAYHGTPHKVDKFSSKKIGTGEGAQAFGWGLYFAGKKEIAEYYRTALSRGSTFTYEVRGEQKEVQSVQAQEIADDLGLGKENRYPGAFMIGRLSEGMTIEAAAQKTRDAYPHWNQAQIEEAIEVVTRANPVLHASGNLYKVDIPNDNELLDWDAPLRQQPPAVQEALARLNPDQWSPEGADYDAEETGQSIYYRLGGKLTNEPDRLLLDRGASQDRAASAALAAAGIPGHRYFDGGSRTAGDGTRNYVIYDDSRIEIVEENPRYAMNPAGLKQLATDVPGLKGVLRYLKPDERAKVKKQNAAALVELFHSMPDPKEMAAVAYAARAKRGWYQKSAHALVEIFGVTDASRFAALLAALSPQTSVESNAINALRTWTNWSKAGRPTDRDTIVRVMGDSVMGGKGVDSVLPAWINNSVNALQSPDPHGVVLSGPKVNSFMLNLRNVVDEVTNDAWMANYALVEQELFRKVGPAPGKGTGYMAMSAAVRKAAETATRLTGQPWTPAEIQETVWSWAKTLYEGANSTISATEVLSAGRLVHEDIATTPDFASLFVSGVYRNILDKGGYADVVRSVESSHRADRAAGLGGDVRDAEGSGLAQDAFERHLRRAAKRLDQLRAQREAASAAPQVDAERYSVTPVSQRPTDPIEDHLPGGKRYGRQHSPGGAISKPSVASPDFSTQQPANRYFGGSVADTQLQMARTGQDGATLVYLTPEDFLALAGAPENPEQLAYDTLAEYGYKFNTIPSLVVDGYAGNVRVVGSDSAHAAATLAKVKAAAYEAQEKGTTDAEQLERGRPAYRRGLGSHPRASTHVGRGVRRVAEGPAELGGSKVIGSWQFPDGRHVYEVADPAGFTARVDAAKAALGPIGAQVGNDPGERQFLFDDGKSGFALDGDNIISVFSSPDSAPGVGERVLEVAIAEGGRRLDGFDTFLPKLYAANGFRAVAKIPFNDEYAPEGWDYDFFQKNFGNSRPHVVFMVYDPLYAKSATDVVIDDYGVGGELQRAALSEIEASDPIPFNKIPVVIYPRSGKPLGLVTALEGRGGKASLEDLGYRVDNPGGEWLRGKQETAEEDFARLRGIRGVTTAYFRRPIELPTSAVAKLPGARGEQRGPGDHQFKALMESVEEHGWQQEKSPILIEVNHRGQAFIVEGNTRTAVANRLGKPTLRAEVKWLNGAEEVAGDWSPAAVAARAVTKGTTEAARVPWPHEGAAEYNPDLRGPRYSVGSPEFRKWFGDSKVVDENGQPLVVYHGSDNAGFTVFSTAGKGQKTAGTGAFFATHQLARTYSRSRNEPEMPTVDEDDGYEYENIAPGIYSVFIKMENPAEIDWQERNWDDGPRGELFVVKNEYGDVVDEFWDEEDANALVAENNADPDATGYYVDKVTEGGLTTDEFVRDVRAWFESDNNAVDGVIIRNVFDSGPYGHGGELGDVYVIFHPTQVKSAVHNRGTWDATDPDIRYSVNAPNGAKVPSTPPQPMFNIVQQRTETFVGKALKSIGRSRRNLPIIGSIFDARVKLQDKMLEVKDAIERIRLAGGEVNDLNDTYMLEQLYHGKVFDEITKRENELQLPLLNALKVAHDGPRKIQPKEFEDYLYARHAPERNAYLRSRGSPVADPAGMSDAEAAAILDKLALEGKLPEMEQLAAKADAIVADITRTRLEAGLISEKAAASSPYRYYVPLRGHETLDPDADTEGVVTRARTGKGFSVGGKEDRSATGRERKAGDILGNLFLQQTDAVVRAEKNAVALSFMRLLADNPNMGFGQIVKSAPTRLVVGANGMIREAGDPFYRQQPDIVTAKWKGKEIVAKVENPRLARAIKSDYVTTSNDLVNALVSIASKLNRYLATINTSLNPEFMISNLARDMQTAGLLAAQYDIKGFGRRIIGDAPKAMAGIREVLRKGTTNGEWAKHFRELQAEGGTTEFLGIQDLETQVARVRRSITHAGLNATARKAMNYLTQVGKFVNDYNKVAENAFRLAAYVNARKAGVSAPKAAYLAKNLTINFNKGGELKGFMNAMYLFYNASTQGTFVLLNGLKNKRVQKIVGGIVIAGLLQDILNRAISDDEDDNGVTDYDDIPDYVLETNFVLMDPLGLLEAVGIKQGYFALPMPYGFNAFYNLGRNLSASFSGSPVRNPAKGAVDSLLTFMDAFNPLGGVQSVWNFMAPTFADPFVDLITNRDYAGNTIVPERPSFSGVPIPESQKYWSNTSDIPVAVADHLNRLTGGNEVRKGAVDVSPEMLQFAFDFATGATGKFIQRAVGLATDTGPKALAGDFENIDVGGIPFLRRVVGSINKRGNTERYYSVAREVATVGDELKLFQETGDAQSVRDLMRRKPVEMQLLSAFEKSDKTLQQMRKQIRELRANDAIPAAKKAELEKKLKEQMDLLMARMNELYFARQRAAAAAASP